MHISCDSWFLACKHLLGHSGNLSICAHMANTNRQRNHRASQTGEIKCKCNGDVEFTNVQLLFCLSIYVNGGVTTNYSRLKWDK